MKQSSKASGNLDIAAHEHKNMALNMKSEHRTLKDKTSEKNPAISQNPKHNPNLIPEPCPASTKIKITEDLTLFLVPRIKLNFIFCSRYGAMNVPEVVLKYLVTSKFENPEVFGEEILIPDEDIHVHYLVPPKMTDDDVEVLAEGCFFLRDPNLKSKDLPLILQKKLLQKLGTFEVKFFDEPYEVSVLPPPFSEDPAEMMASVSGSTEDPPTIILKGIPSQWFFEQPNSSKPSKKLLHIFLETFGEIRDLDVVEDDEFGKDARNGDKASSILYCKVLVQYEKYEDCENALKYLCSHSLQKGSNMIADYEVSWKEDLCQSASRSSSSTIRPVCCDGVAAKRPLDDDSIAGGSYSLTKQGCSAPVESSIEGITMGLLQQVEALKQLSRELRAKDERITMLEEELKFGGCQGTKLIRASYYE